MLESNLEVVKKDMDALVKDAQELFHAAALVTGEKADELRNRGLRLLDASLDKAKQATGISLAPLARKLPFQPTSMCGKTRGRRWPWPVVWVC